MYHIIGFIGFIAVSMIGWMVIWWVANAYIIPTYYPWHPLYTYQQAVIISAIIVIIAYLILSPKIHSERLHDYMKYWYKEPPMKKKDKK